MDGLEDLGGDLERGAESTLFSSFIRLNMVRHFSSPQNTNVNEIELSQIVSFFLNCLTRTISIITTNRVQTLPQIKLYHLKWVLLLVPKLPYNLQPPMLLCFLKIQFTSNYHLFLGYLVPSQIRICVFLIITLKHFCHANSNLT